MGDRARAARSARPEPGRSMAPWISVRRFQYGDDRNPVFVTARFTGAPPGRCSCDDITSPRAHPTAPPPGPPRDRARRPRPHLVTCPRHARTALQVPRAAIEPPRSDRDLAETNAVRAAHPHGRSVPADTSHRRTPRTRWIPRLPTSRTPPAPPTAVRLPPAPPPSATPGIRPHMRHADPACIQPGTTRWTGQDPAGASPGTRDGGLTSRLPGSQRSPRGSGHRRTPQFARLRDHGRRLRDGTSAPHRKAISPKRPN
jgi:hypothetical protein